MIGNAPGRRISCIGRLRTGRDAGSTFAFRVDNRPTVHAFHAAAIAAGGRDNEGPGPRPDYRADYYAAFVFDPDGHNVEAVTYSPIDFGR